MKPLGLYLHIPYCPYRCHYCDFLILTNRHDTIPRYVKSIINDLENFAMDYSEYEIQSIFIGGGTPSLLSPDSLHKILQTIQHCFSVTSNPEITLESNPDTLTFEKLTRFLEIGINRLSLGVQSLHDGHLERMGRGHKAKEAFEVFQITRKAGFRNINLDLIFGLPKQTLDEWVETLETCLAWKPEHFSAYGLQLENGTNFWNAYQKNQLSLPDNDLQADMYEALLDLSGQNGYHQYEISNFSKPGFQSKHNLIYWKNEEYLGFGLGAVSYVNKKRFWMTRSLSRYFSGERIVGSESLSSKKQMGESLMLGLRLKEGISLTEFSTRFGENLNKLYKDEINRFKSLSLLIHQGDRLALTQKGMLLSNEVLQAFV